MAEAKRYVLGKVVWRKFWVSFVTDKGQLGPLILPLTF